jgi:hypothetical protein
MAKLKEEFFKLLPPTIYFFVALHIVAFVRVLMLKGTGIAPSSTIKIAVAALILGKAVLLADMLPLINRFPNKPLIYNVAWKTLIYLVISAIIHYLERLIDFWRETGSFVAGNEKLLSLIIWPHFWAIQIILLVLIAMYCMMHELVRVVGKEKVMRIFFGPMPVPEV